MADRNDLTTGPIIKKLLIFFVPIAAGLLFQQLYNAVDAIVVSKFVGTVALAAVGGSPATVSNLIISFCNALTNGAAVVISQFFGARDMKNVKRAVQTSYKFCVLIGVVVGAVTILFSPQILTVLKTPAETFADALIYQRIYFAGAVFILTYNMGAGILRAVGDSRFPFLCLCVSCVTNIVLDIVFVICFHWGVAGVAIATVIAQLVSSAMVTVKLLRTHTENRLVLSENLWDAFIMKKMLHIGIPSGLQASMYGISNMILQVAVNTLGTIAVASWTMTGKIDGTYWSIANAFGLAITTFIGQNYGAGNIHRVRETAKKGFWTFILMTLIMSGIIMVTGQFLLNLFTDDQQVIDMTWYMMLFFVPVYFTWSAIEVYSGVLRGVGDTIVPFIILGLGICGVRIAWVLMVFRANPTVENVCICYPLSWVITSIVLFIYYKTGSVVAKELKEKQKMVTE